MIVTIDVAKLANKLGFNLECDTVYKQPIITLRGTDIKQKRPYRQFNNYEYTSMSELSFSKKVYLAPTQRDLNKWLTETYEIYCVVLPEIIEFNNSKDEIKWSYQIYNLKTYLERGKSFGIGLLEKGVIIPNVYYEYYEDAMEAGLKEALNSIK